MCGIFGVVGQNINKDDFVKCVESIKHRGPDGKGFYFDKNIALGFRRLSILDLSADANQPMTSEKKDVWLIFNGEIYNFIELRNILKRKHQFISKTDSEILIHGYEEWGIEGLLKRIEGMFAFCIYDVKKKVCFLARDRIGEKPLYIFERRNQLSFSSEIKAFFKLDNFEFSLDENKLNVFWDYPYLPDNKKTIIRNVFKVSPGSYLKVEVNGNFKKKEYIYWDYDKVGVGKMDFEEGKDKLLELIEDSIKKRLTADVPVGVLLSGGLDSSLITAIAAKASPSKIKTINISFPGSVVDESNYAKKVAQFCGTDYLSLKLKPFDLYNQLKENIWIFDDPSTLDGGILSTYLMCQEIKKTGIKVLLTGEGADEVFGGYSWFNISRMAFLPESIKTALYYYAIMRKYSGNKLFVSSKIMRIKMNEISDNYFKKIQRFEIKYSLPNNYCMKLDRASSAASMETRPPYLDYRIVELSKSFPVNYFLRFDINRRRYFGKYILRLAAKDYLPEDIYFRKKKGGMLPVADILREGLRKDSGLILENNYLVSYFGKKELERLINRKSTFVPDVWEKEWLLWKFLVFSLWLLKYEEYGKNTS